MIRVSIICDHAEGPRAKEGKPSDWCRSAVGQTIEGEHRNADTACSTARHEARRAGWKSTKVDRNGRHGWLCPNCYAREYL